MAWDKQVDKIFGKYSSSLSSGTGGSSGTDSNEGGIISESGLEEDITVLARLLKEELEYTINISHMNAKSKKNIINGITYTVIPDANTALFNISYMVDSIYVTSDSGIDYEQGNLAMILNRGSKVKESATVRGYYEGYPFKYNFGKDPKFSHQATHYTTRAAFRFMTEHPNCKITNG